MHGRWFGSALLAALTLWLTGACLAGDQTRVGPMVRIELKFVENRIEVVSIRRIRSVPYGQYGVPQMAPLFYEIVGQEGEVFYAGELMDPRFAFSASTDPTVSTTGSSGKPPYKVPREGTSVIKVPEVDGAREIRVYRRISDDPDSGRELLLKAGL